MNCPHCNKPIRDELITSAGAKIMQAKGKSKRRYTSEQARDAVTTRWEKYREAKALLPSAETDA